MFVLRFLDVLLFLLTAGNARPDPKARYWDEPGDGKTEI